MKVLQEATNPSMPNRKKIPRENHFSIHTLETLKSRLRALPELQPQPKSVFSRIADFWGGFSWWFKALVLFVLVTPIIVTTLYFEMPLIFIAAGAVAGLYISVSLLLDNQHHVQQNMYQECEQKMSVLFQNIESELGRIWGIGSTLFYEFGSTDTNNQKLSAQVESSGLESSKLNEEIFNLKEEKVKLSESNKNLEAINFQLQQQIHAISSTNNDRFLSTLIAHMNQSPGQYAFNPPVYGANQMQYGSNPNLMQRNFFNEVNGGIHTNPASMLEVKNNNAGNVGINNT